MRAWLQAERLPGRPAESLTAGVTGHCAGSWSGFFDQMAHFPG